MKSSHYLGYSRPLFVMIFTFRFFTSHAFSKNKISLPTPRKFNMFKNSFFARSFYSPIGLNNMDLATPISKIRKWRYALFIGQAPPVFGVGVSVGTALTRIRNPSRGFGVGVGVRVVQMPTDVQKESKCRQTRRNV